MAPCPTTRHRLDVAAHPAPAHPRGRRLKAPVNAGRRHLRAPIALLLVALVVLTTRTARRNPWRAAPLPRPVRCWSRSRWVHRICWGSPAARGLSVGPGATDRRRDCLWPGTVTRTSTPAVDRHRHLPCSSNRAGRGRRCAPAWSPRHLQVWCCWGCCRSRRRVTSCSPTRRGCRPGPITAQSGTWPGCSTERSRSVRSPRWRCSPGDGSAGRGRAGVDAERRPALAEVCLVIAVVIAIVTGKSVPEHLVAAGPAGCAGWPAVARPSRVGQHRGDLLRCGWQPCILAAPTTPTGPCRCPGTPSSPCCGWPESSSSARWWLRARARPAARASIDARQVIRRGPRRLRRAIGGRARRGRRRDPIGPRSRVRARC